MWELDCKESWAPKNWCFWTVVLEKTLESPLDCKEIQPVHPKGDQSWVFIGRIWCWSWNSNTLATSCEELTHWKRPWCWEGLGAEGEGDYRGWDGWTASLTRWPWVWVNSGSWWWTGRPGVLWFMGSQRVGHDWATELNWTEPNMMNGSALWRLWDVNSGPALSLTRSYFHHLASWVSVILTLKEKDGKEVIPGPFQLRPQPTISMKKKRLFQKEIFLRNSLTKDKLNAMSKSNCIRSQTNMWRKWIIDYKLCISGKNKN